MDELLICRNIPLKKYCGYRTGGAAEFYFEPWDMEELKSAVKKHEQITIIGSGYNTLIRDGGVDGLVIRLCSDYFKRINCEKNIITAGAGVLLSDLLSYCRKANLAGLEYLSAIPGTIGGAVRGNAGSFQRAIGDNILSINVLNYDGIEENIKKEELSFSYRSLRSMNEKIITSVELFVETAPDYNIGERIDIYKKQRSVANLDGFTCGSVFKNPKNIKAWKLIEQAGLRGHRIGSARIFDKHCNWVVADRDAFSDDIEELINLIKKRVKEVSEVDLCCEIVLIGNRCKI